MGAVKAILTVLAGVAIGVVVTVGAAFYALARAIDANGGDL